jgi:plasmid replication initiation protein
MATKKQLKITKSNDINQANFSDFSLSSYRVFLNLLALLKRYDIDKNLIPLELSNRTVRLSASDYAKEFDIEEANAYGILKQAVDQLLKTSYSIKEDDNDITKINICSQAKYRKFKGYIDIEFTPNIMPHLAGLKNKFTMYNLNDVAGFDSIYSTRLYELIMQFKLTGELEISIEKLRFSLGCVVKFKLYADLKRFTIQHAVDEINSQWTLNLKYEEIKTGRTVTDLIFTFNKTYSKKVYDPATKKMRTQLTKPRRKPQDPPDVGGGGSGVFVHPEQQELPLNETTGQKILKTIAKGLEKTGVEPVPETIKALDERKDNGVKETIKAVVKGGINADKRRITNGIEKVKTTAQSVNKIISSLMRVKKLTEEEATIFAIEHELI